MEARRMYTEAIRRQLADLAAANNVFETAPPAKSCPLKFMVAPIMGFLSSLALPKIVFRMAIGIMVLSLVVQTVELALKMHRTVPWAGIPSLWTKFTGLLEFSSFETSEEDGKSWVLEDACHLIMDADKRGEGEEVKADLLRMIAAFKPRTKNGFGTDYWSEPVSFEDAEERPEWDTILDDPLAWDSFLDNPLFWEEQVTGYEVEERSYKEEGAMEDGEDEVGWEVIANNPPLP
ncbi:hypothetical protein B0J14DRAFT_563100 [Halenospora varia]|nr:hypothetical protein B0J14DRAFT_563100 [Halenospora varia]